MERHVEVGSDSVSRKSAPALTTLSMNVSRKNERQPRQRQIKLKGTGRQGQTSPQTVKKVKEVDVSWFKNGSTLRLTSCSYGRAWSVGRLSGHTRASNLRKSAGVQVG
jgi:hypothetical protein